MLKAEMSNDRVTAGKIAANIFWDLQGFLVVYYLREHRTINSYYVILLRDIFKKGIRNERKKIKLLLTKLQ